jgi:hypothetical protein
MTILSRIAGEVVSKTTKEVAAKGGKEAASKVGKEAAAKVAKQAGSTIARDVVATSGKEVAEKTAKKIAEEAANPAFDAAMAAVRERLSKAGKYANVSTPLMEAIAQASTTEEALQVANLARKLSVRFNKANRGALLAALETAAQKSQVHDEAFRTLVNVVKSRQEAYALFSLAEKNKVVATAVERYLQVGGPPMEELATKAVKLVKPRVDQHSAGAYIKKLLRLETLGEQVRTLANYINKALN